MSEDFVNHPSHYCQEGKRECIDVIRELLGDEGCYNFCMGNMLKYTYRAGHKWDSVEDLKKADWYLQFAIKIAEGSDTSDRNLVKNNK